MAGLNVWQVQRERRVYNCFMHEREYNNNDYSRYGRAIVNLFFRSIE